MDDCATYHLCANCLHFEGCWIAQNKFPVFDCSEFEPEDDEEYPDGDAYWEYINAALYGKEVVGHAD